MPIDRVDILLNVTDVERSVAFYRDLLGMTLEATWTDPDGRSRWAKLITTGGHSVLMLNEPEGKPLTDRLSRPAYRDAVLYVQVQSTDELLAVHRRLGDANARPGECRDEAYGQREFSVRDPDGYELAVCAQLG